MFHSPAPRPGTLRPQISGHRGILVLVFAHGWGTPNEATLDDIRAELRGLGASLLVFDELVFDDQSSFYFRPDAHISEPPPELSSSVIRDLARARGAPGGARSSSLLGLRVLDEDGTLRLDTERPIHDSVPAALLEALRVAGRSALQLGSTALLSRREIVLYSLVGALALVLGEGCRHERHPPRTAPLTQGTELPVVLNVNGQEHHLNLEPRVSLLDALRERLGLTGTKKGCDHGQCGACTVLLDNRRVNACLTLAVMAQRKPITTIEGLAREDELHPMQDAFIAEDALQCGYCTPGQIVSAVGLVKENRAFSDDEVREHMSGNICRCGAYVNIIHAIQLARKGMPV
jgi:xanthine dehydrogenase YagT iron-sulfur-binding subunit